MSQRDACELFRLGVEAEKVRWSVVFGTLNNPCHHWSLAEARQELGYAPVDAAPVEHQRYHVYRNTFLDLENTK